MFTPLTVMVHYVVKRGCENSRQDSHLSFRIVLPDIISSDQTGFIKNRFFNVRHLFNIIYHPSDFPVPEILISMDAEKVFERVEWSYLFHGFGLEPLSLAVRYSTQIYEAL